MSPPASPSNTNSLFRPESSELIDEQRTSRLAIVALVVGLASFVALTTPILWLVPAIGVLVSIFALRSIATNSDSISGRGIAISALTLACFFGALAPVRHLTRQHRLYGQARQLAEKWLDLLRDGRVHEAHQMRLVYQERVTADADLDQHYENQQQKMAFEFFRGQSPVGELIRWGRTCEVRFVSNEFMETTGSNDVISQKYDIVKLRGGQEVVVKAQIAIRRQIFPGTHEARWNIEGIEVLSLPSNLPP